MQIVERFQTEQQQRRRGERRSSPDDRPTTEELLETVANILTFMAEPWFAIPWHAIGIAGAVWVIYDGQSANSALNPPLKACWPILILFFSVVGIAVYLVFSRPPGIGTYPAGKLKMRHFTAYARPTWRKVFGSAAHCVGGDGLGIMAAMAGGG
ncbi:hypothetical protein [Palleronia sp.]|uniref:hypothetical protein n=1 Tax=Palleronia sp. TaxID=1940284 RepID=UPI0035C81CFF